MKNGLKRIFVTVGVLPFLLIAALVIFTLLSDNFLSVRNMSNVVRQSVTLVIVSLGQMFALLTGGFVALYGVDETVALIEKGLAGELG